VSLVNLDRQLSRVKVSPFDMDNAIVFTFFEQLPSGDRDDALLRALYIGVLALMEDRFSALLSKTENELGSRLESLKMIFEMKREIFFKTAKKGLDAEAEVAASLNEYFAQRGFSDVARMTGSIGGEIENNKTGDIVCFVDGLEDVRIAIECKFDKATRVGGLDRRDFTAKKVDTAWSQLLEAQVNRSAAAAIIVFDAALADPSIVKEVESVGYLHQVGLVAIVDSQRGDFSNLFIAYGLARDIAIRSKRVSVDNRTLTLIVERLVSDMRDCLKVQDLVKRNIQINREILTQLHKGMLTLQFSQRYLLKFLEDGRLTSEDLLDFYFADDIRDKFAPLEKEVREIAGSV
jgi:hypothetical protein